MLMSVNILAVLQLIPGNWWLLSDLLLWQRSVFLSGTLSIHNTNVSDPRANLYSPLTLNFASILVNCSLVRKGIIQTGNANVNEIIFAYLYFPVVEMSLVLTFCYEECHSRWPLDTLLAMRRSDAEEKPKQRRAKNEEKSIEMATF